MRDGVGVQADHYPSRVPLVLRAPSACPFHKEDGDPTSKDNRDRMVDLRPVTPLSPSMTLGAYGIGMSLLGYESIWL